MPNEHDQELIIVRRFTSAMFAEEARVFLENNDIKAMVVTDEAGGAIPSLGMASGGARLLVRADDLEAAQELLAPEEA
jgi:hypothetical protein